MQKSMYGSFTNTFQQDENYFIFLSACFSYDVTDFIILSHVQIHYYNLLLFDVCLDSPRLMLCVTMQKKKLLEGAAGEEMKKKWKRMTSASDAAKNFIRRKKLK